MTNYRDSATKLKDELKKLLFLPVFAEAQTGRKQTRRSN
jgi:hypothetical protein